MENQQEQKELRELKRKLENTEFVSAVELPKKQVVVYVSAEAVTLLHVPSGREKAIVVPLDDFVKRVTQDNATDSGNGSDTEPTQTEQ